MVAHLTLRTNGVKQGFRFVEGMWLHRKSSQTVNFFLQKRPPLHHTSATCSELSSYTMYRTQNLGHAAYLIRIFIKNDFRSQSQTPIYTPLSLLSLKLKPHI